uniref:ADH_N domain-containing protein n=1 Tax=Macrostomum lignano TaxID=282301 RepID=A0A1I8F669_9PLAT
NRYPSGRLRLWNMRAPPRPSAADQQQAIRSRCAQSPPSLRSRSPSLRKRLRIVAASPKVARPPGRCRRPAADNSAARCTIGRLGTAGRRSGRHPLCSRESELGRSDFVQRRCAATVDDGARSVGPVQNGKLLSRMDISAQASEVAPATASRTAASLSAGSSVWPRAGELVATVRAIGLGDGAGIWRRRQLRRQTRTRRVPVAGRASCWRSMSTDPSTLAGRPF